MPSTGKEVSNASTVFFAALNRRANGNNGTNSAVLSPGEALTTMHPVSGRQVGWSQVQESFHRFSLAITVWHLRLEAGNRAVGNSSTTTRTNLRP